MVWRVYVKNLETNIKIGIHDHEQEPQRVLVNATVTGRYPAHPSSIGDCFNYDHIHKLVVNEWQKRPHTKLLETLVVEVLEYIFRIDSRVESAKVSLCKPDIFKMAESVGVEAEWSREEYLRFCSNKKAS
jgi:7,8-dihydroneopterin aldolase/epimerase/oxygenase